MSRFLMVAWDGAGNLVPTLGIAQRLVEGGHDVRLLGHRSIQDRVEASGWRFRPLERANDWSSTAPSDQATEIDRLVHSLWFHPAVADDVLAELDREPADVLIADCMLYAALVAGQARAIPTVALFHIAISAFRDGPLFEFLSAGLPAINELRSRLGLREVASIADIHDQCDRLLVAMPREFDVEVPLPDTVEFVGPVLDGPLIDARAEHTTVEDGPSPLVVVSFSTSHQGQQGVVQHIIDALADVDADVVVTTGSAVSPQELQPRGNTRLAAFVPHAELLPNASVVVTHGGLGTIMAALAHGVPLVCVPMGRDQFFNSAMVERLGVGVVVGADAGADAIRASVEAVSADDARKGAAKAFAAVIATYSGADAAAGQVEALAGAR